jgi:uncharacterized protein YrrD
MNATELLGRPVLDLATATTAGRVDDVVIDPATRRVRGLRIAKAAAGADWLAWDDIAAIGPDAVTIQAAERITSFDAADAGRSLRGDGALGGRVLTDEGRGRGVLDDVEFDDAGDLVALLVASDRVVPDDLIGIGSYATVVRDRAGA